jgi:hypothetical protein
MALSRNGGYPNSEVAIFWEDDDQLLGYPMFIQSLNGHHFKYPPVSNIIMEAMARFIRCFAYYFNFDGGFP